MRQTLLRNLLVLLLTVLSVQRGWAQGTTTSSMTGVITDQTGAGLPGATIIAVHTPTNTQYVAPTNSDGRYNIQNMRVGGPYTVRVTFVGYQDVTRENIFLTLGQDQRLDINLSETSTELAGVEVTGVDPRSLMNTERTGPITSVSTEAIQRLPTISRSLNDFTRLTPQASPTSTGAIGGGNYRQNNITVDGSDFNNNFGIGGNLPAGGSPISLDAIETLTVNIAPVDVRQSSFIGSAVNAITRSGTNQFSGSVYSFYRNQNYIGNEVGYDKFTKQKTNNKQFGFRLGGPIIKDKLFFFANAERSVNTNPGQQNIASTDAVPYGGSNSPANVVRPDAATLDSYSNYLRETYGYETGPYQGYNFQSENTRILGRLDWNVSNNHHVSVRYNQVESQTPSFVSASRNIGSLTAFPSTRTSNFALPYRNSNYYQDANFYSLAAEWNGTFGKFFNTLRGTYTHQNDPRSSDSEIFPFVDILEGTVPRNTATGQQTGYANPYTSFGYEPFTYGNLRDVKTYSLVDFVTATYGRHTLTAGGQFDLQTTKNGFQRVATSYYAFNSWDDFINKRNPVDFALTYSLLPGYEQAFPRYKTAQYSLFAQDEFAVTDRLRLTYGVRAELNSYLNVDEVQTHPLVAALTFMDGKKIDTGVLPKNRVLVSPRIGFNWDAKGDRTLQVRGSTGIFAGRVPTVWIVAQSGDAGLLQVTQSWTTLNGGTLPYANMPFDPDPAAYRPTTQPTPGTVIPSAISATARDFKNPQSWKNSLAVDAQLPGGIVGTLEGIYTRDLRVAIGKNYNLVNPQQLTLTGYPDNRDIYPSSNGVKYINPLNSAGQATGGTLNQPFTPIVLSNGHRGYYWSATAKLEKQFNRGILASLAYVRSDARNLYDGTGDQLINTWSNTQVVNNANNPPLSYANYIAPSRIVASLSYRKEYLNHLGTQISLFYNGSIQGRFSYVYGADFNRDGQNGNDLIYVPNNATEITFTDFNYGTTAAPKIYTAAQQSEIFFRYIEQDDYLRSRRGKYAERNGAKLPWLNQFDFRFAQDVFVTAGKRNTLQFTFDVANLGNLLNKEWGISQIVNNTSILVPTNQGNLIAGGTTRPTFRLATDRNQPISSTFRNAVNTGSTYSMQVGLRYIFN